MSSEQGLQRRLEEVSEELRVSQSSNRSLQAQMEQASQEGTALTGLNHRSSGVYRNTHTQATQAAQGCTSSTSHISIGYLSFSMAVFLNPYSIHYLYLPQSPSVHYSHKLNIEIQKFTAKTCFKVPLLKVQMRE